MDVSSSDSLHTISMMVVNVRTDGLSFLTLYHFEGGGLLVVYVRTHRRSLIVITLQFYFDGGGLGTERLTISHCTHSTISMVVVWVRTD